MTQKEASGKTTAAIAYITIIGVLIAFSMNQSNKDPFARFHIRQAFGLHITFLLLGFLIGFFNSMMITASFWLFFFILWGYGFLGAMQNRKNLIPIFGKPFQQWFTFIQ